MTLEPKVGYARDLFIQKRPDGRMSGFYPSPRLFLTAGTNPVFKVHVVVVADDEAVESDYWAWWSAADQTFKFVWPARFLVEMCFTYGSQAETERGRGRICRVRVEEAGDALSSQD